MNLNEKQIRFLIRQSLIEEGFTSLGDSPVARFFGYRTKEEKEKAEREETDRWNNAEPHEKANPDNWVSLKGVSKAFRKDYMAEIERESAAEETRKAIGMSPSDERRVDLDMEIHQLYADRLQPYIDMLDSGKDPNEMFGTVYGVPEDAAIQPKLKKEKERMDIDRDGDLDANDISTLVLNHFNNSKFSLGNIKAVLDKNLSPDFYQSLRAGTNTNYKDSDYLLLLTKYFGNKSLGNFYFKKRYDGKNNSSYICRYINALIVPAPDFIELEDGEKVQIDSYAYDSEDYGNFVLFDFSTYVNLHRDIANNPYVIDERSENISIETDSLSRIADDSVKKSFQLQLDFTNLYDSSDKIKSQFEANSDRFFELNFKSKLSNTLIKKINEKIQDENQRAAELELSRERSVSARGQEMFEKFGVKKGDEILALHDMISDGENKITAPMFRDILANVNLLIKNQGSLDIDIPNFGNVGKKLRRGILEFRTKNSVRLLSKVDEKLESMLQDVKERIREKEKEMQAIAAAEKERQVALDKQRDESRRANLTHATYGVEPGEELIELKNLLEELKQENNMLQKQKQSLYIIAIGVIKEGINLLEGPQGSKIMSDRITMKHLRKAIKEMRLGPTGIGYDKATDKLFNTVDAMRNIK